MRDRLIAVVEGLRPSDRARRAARRVRRGCKATLATFDPLGPVRAVVDALAAPRSTSFAHDFAPSTLLAPVLTVYDDIAGGDRRASTSPGCSSPCSTRCDEIGRIIDRGMDEVIDALGELKSACESDGGPIPGLDLSICAASRRRRRRARSGCELARAARHRRRADGRAPPRRRRGALPQARRDDGASVARRRGGDRRRPQPLRGDRAARARPRPGRRADMLGGPDQAPCRPPAPCTPGRASTPCSAAPASSSPRTPTCSPRHLAGGRRCCAAARRTRSAVARGRADVDVRERRRRPRHRRRRRSRRRRCASGEAFTMGLVGALAYHTVVAPVQRSAFGRRTSRPWTRTQPGAYNAADDAAALRRLIGGTDPVGAFASWWPSAEQAAPLLATYPRRARRHLPPRGRPDRAQGWPAFETAFTHRRPGARRRTGLERGYERLVSDLVAVHDGRVVRRAHADPAQPRDRRCSLGGFLPGASAWMTDGHGDRALGERADHACPTASPRSPRSSTR